MKPFGIIIAEHDQPDRDRLKKMIYPLRQFKVIGVSDSGSDLWGQLQFKQPDAIILNLSLPELNGIQGVNEIKTMLPYVQIILLTDHVTYPGEVFDLSVTDYLKKPFIKSRFYDALKKGWYALNHIYQTPGAGMITEKLEVRMNHALLFIPFHEILFIERMKRKSFIHTLHHTYETYESLNSIMDRLSYHFFQTHRSFIVNLEHIYKIEPDGQTYLVHFKNFKKRAFISKNNIQKIKYLLSRVQ